MTADPKKPGVAFWASMAVVCLPLLYVLSFGPACWASSRGIVPYQFGVAAVESLYHPMLRLGVDGPDSVSGCIQWWAKLKAEPGWYMRGGCGTDNCYWCRPPR
jgi:hypothetical protein